jgi:hypothetical protein
MAQQDLPVTLRLENLPRLASNILERNCQSGKTWIEWDEENWHYTGVNYEGSESRRKERVVLYLLTLDAINFCFWPERGSVKTINPLEYDTLALALKKMAETDDKKKRGSNGNDFAIIVSEDTYAFSPKRLAEMTPERLQSSLEPHLKGHYLDNITKRSELLNEVGEGLLKNFNGSATRLLGQAEGKAPKLVELILKHFIGFRDISYRGVWFLKRAQIFVGDINAALNLELLGMDELTTFADYRVPQILRHFDILEYAPALAIKVDSWEEIEVDSIEELSIRAGTVRAVEELVMYLNGKLEKGGDKPFTDVAGKLLVMPFVFLFCISDIPPLFFCLPVDWYLWQVGERMNQESQLKPFHKVRTQFY